MGLTGPSTNGENYYRLPTKRGKKYRLATEKLNEIYRQPTKVANVKRQTTK